jgi:hypothetical protein
MDDPVGNRLRAHPLVQFPRFVWNEQPQPSVWRRWLHHPIDAPRGLAVFPLPIGFDDRVVRPFNPNPTTEITSFLRPSCASRRLLIAHLEAHHAGSVTNVIVADADPARDPDLVALGTVSPALPNDTVHYESYHDALHDSRASISFPGAGYDTARFWEILAAGALLISKGIQIEMPDPPVAGEHYVAFETLPELDDAIEFVRANPAEADAIRRRGQELALAKHSPDAHAAWFVDRLRAVRPDLGVVPGGQPVSH